MDQSSDALPQGGERPRHGCNRDDALRGAREISPFMRRDQSIYFRGTNKPVRLFWKY